MRHDDRNALAARDARIRRMHAEGVPVPWLCQQFGLSKSTVYEAIHGGVEIETDAADTYESPLPEWEQNLVRVERSPEQQRHYPLDALQDAPRRYYGSCVYFIQAGDHGPVKVGLSTTGGLTDRLRTLQIGNAETLAVRRVVIGDEPLERLLHGHFAELRIRGEWFSYEGELADSLAPYVHDLRAEGMG